MQQYACRAMSFSTGTVPNLAALPFAASGIGDWNNFPGPSWALNTPWVDLTGVTMIRITNSSLSANPIGMEYSTGCCRISQPFTSGGSSFYWIIVLEPATSNTWCGKYNYTANTIDSSSWFTVPIASANIGHSFSMLVGETNILYIADPASNQIRRYDVNAQAYAANTVFNGANASVSSPFTNIGWLGNSWDGQYLYWTAQGGVATGYGMLEVQSGTLTSYTTPAGLANSKALRAFKGGSMHGCVFPTSDGLDNFKVWFADSNKTTEINSLANGYSPAGKAGHSICTDQYMCALDSDFTSYGMAVQTFGAVPASDGGAYTGTFTLKTYGSAPFAGDQEENETWIQPGLGQNFYLCASHRLRSHKGVQNAWSVFSGSIYQSTVTIPSGYSQTFTGVVLVGGSSGSDWIGKLPIAASTGAMTAGSCFWNGTNTLYVWLSGGGDPTGLVRVVVVNACDDGLGYFQLSGADMRKLCFHYNISYSDGGTFLGTVAIGTNVITCAAGTGGNGIITGASLSAASGFIPGGATVASQTATTVTFTGSAATGTSGAFESISYSSGPSGLENYYPSAFANWSPDGKIAVWTCNFGVHKGRHDVCLVRVPVK